MWRCTQEAEESALEMRQDGDEPLRGFKSYHLRQKSAAIR